MYKFLAVLVFVALAAAAPRDKRDYYGSSIYGSPAFDDYSMISGLNSWGSTGIRGRSLDLGLAPGEYDLNTFGFPSRHIYTGPIDTQVSHDILY